MTAQPPKFQSFFEMLVSTSVAAAEIKEETWRPPPTNPYPSGTILKGRTTQRVLDELTRIAPKALTHGQLRHRCNAGRGAVSWATAFLIHHGKIEALTDPRQANYCRYRLTPARVDDET